jgi:hypothetical protein
LAKRIERENVNIAMIRVVLAAEVGVIFPREKLDVVAHEIASVDQEFLDKLL